MIVQVVILQGFVKSRVRYSAGQMSGSNAIVLLKNGTLKLCMDEKEALLV